MSRSGRRVEQAWFLARQREREAHVQSHEELESYFIFCGIEKDVLDALELLHQ